MHQIAAYIGEDNPRAAARTVFAINSHIRMVLPNYPNSGRAGRVFGTREAAIPKLPYFTVYRVADNTVEILRILHCAQECPKPEK